MLPIISSLSQLGQYISKQLLPNLEQYCYAIASENPWFTKENLEISLKSWSECLNEENLQNWLMHYTPTEYSKKIGIVAAGNIPLVSFHDFICVLASGNQVYFKKSQTDSLLINLFTKQLIEIDPSLEQSIFFVDRLNNVDAVIATGSNNSSRYFEYYFSKIPHIIRKNRTSVAVLDGNESSDELMGLCADIFTYFGLGCRNVAKIYVPENYDLNTLFAIIEQNEVVKMNTKFMNNYDYTRTIWMMNKEKFFDIGNLLVKESNTLHSGIACLFYEIYNDPKKLKQELENIETELQCVVTNLEIVQNKVKFGQTQQPRLFDYADNINTLDFLLSIKN